MLKIDHLINQIKNSKLLKNQRNPGIDIIRLIGMYLIVFHHFISFGRLLSKYPIFKKEILFVESFINWHNNSFALISGIVGYKKSRYSNLLYLWFTVFFYSVGIYLYVGIFNKNYIKTRNFTAYFFPIIYKRYWYFTAYFGMYLFLPIINSGISCLNKKELKIIVSITLGIFVIWKDFNNPNDDVFNFNSGHSTIWLLTFYLTGAYIGKYKVYYSGSKKFIILFS